MSVGRGQDKQEKLKLLKEAVRLHPTMFRRFFIGQGHILKRKNMSPPRYGSVKFPDRASSQRSEFLSWPSSTTQEILSGLKKPSDSSPAEFRLSRSINTWE